MRKKISYPVILTKSNICSENREILVSSSPVCIQGRKQFTLGGISRHSQDLQVLLSFPPNKREIQLISNSLSPRRWTLSLNLIRFEKIKVNYGRDA